MIHRAIKTLFIAGIISSAIATVADSNCCPSQKPVASRAMKDVVKIAAGQVDLMDDRYEVFPHKVLRWVTRFYSSRENGLSYRMGWPSSSDIILEM